MEFTKIIVDTVLSYQNGTKERKEFIFEKLGQVFEYSLIKYIMDNTPNCSNVSIIDVWSEKKK